LAELKNSVLSKSGSVNFGTLKSGQCGNNTDISMDAETHHWNRFDILQKQEADKWTGINFC
jgi:hypothetical protein